MISQVGLFTQENADKLEAEDRGNLYRFFYTPEEKAELIKISEEYKNYLAKVKATMDELVNDPMYRVAVGDVGGKYRDRGPGFQNKDQRAKLFTRKTTLKEEQEFDLEKYQMLRRAGIIK